MYQMEVKISKSMTAWQISSTELLSLVSGELLQYEAMTNWVTRPSIETFLFSYLIRKMSQQICLPILEIVCQYFAKFALKCWCWWFYELCELGHQNCTVGQTQFFFYDQSHLLKMTNLQKNSYQLIWKCLMKLRTMLMVCVTDCWSM